VLVRAALARRILVMAKTALSSGSTRFLHHTFFYLLTRGFNWEVELNMKVAQPLLNVKGTPRVVVGGIKKKCCAARVWKNSLERCCGSSSQSVPYLITCEVTLLLVLFLSATSPCRHKNPVKDFCWWDLDGVWCL
jgi:hypothetical protein